jgi:hypothetical protein
VLRFAASAQTALLQFLWLHLSGAKILQDWQNACLSRYGRPAIRASLIAISAILLLQPSAHQEPSQRFPKLFPSISSCILQSRCVRKFERFLIAINKTIPSFPIL